MVSRVTLSGRVLRPVDTWYREECREENSSAQPNCEPRLPAYISCLPMQLRAIPGYGGYVPAKCSDGIVGAPFKRANHLAAYARAGQTEEHLNASWGWNPLGLGFRTGSEIPGYAGHIPGRFSENILGETHSRANYLAAAVKRRQYQQLKEDHSRQLEAGRAVFAHREGDGNTGMYTLHKELRSLAN